MTGEQHIARNGAGFLVNPEPNEATWIEREDLATALVGDTVTVIGRDGGEEIPAGALADLLDTIDYEVVCNISKRVTRVYLKDGKEDSVFDCILG